MTEKVPIIIQARVNSTRLRNKVLLEINEKPLIEYVVNQISAAMLVDYCIIATSTNSKDDKIVDFCERKKIRCFRGSEEDVLDRYYKCAKHFNCKTIIRISADSPLIDPNVIDEIITKFQNNKFDYVSNNISYNDGQWEESFCDYPQGMVVEITSFQILETAWKNAIKKSEREHVFPYVQSHSEMFNITNVKNNTKLSQIRCTVDKKEDFEFIKKIIEKMKNEKIIKIKDICEIVKNEPDLLKINSKVDPFEGYKKSQMLDDLKDIQ
jgi:spore coat polysaccharide biosynthesis protein SpsF